MFLRRSRCERACASDDEGSQHDAGSPSSRAVDRARTGDLDLGKVALYQLSYYRKDWRVYSRWVAGYRAAPCGTGAGAGATIANRLLPVGPATGRSAIYSTSLINRMRPLLAEPRSTPAPCP